MNNEKYRQMIDNAANQAGVANNNKDRVRKVHNVIRHPDNTENTENRGADLNQMDYGTRRPEDIAFMKQAA